MSGVVSITIAITLRRTAAVRQRPFAEGGRDVGRRRPKPRSDLALGCARPSPRRGPALRGPRLGDLPRHRGRRRLRPYALSFRYGQRHTSSSRPPPGCVAAIGAAEHRIVDIDLAAFGGSALVGDGDDPQGPSRTTRSAPAIPATYVPRPQHHLPRLRPGVGRGARRRRHLHRGQRPRLLRLSRLPSRVHRRVRGMANLATRAGMEGDGSASAPRCIGLTKAEIIRGARALGVDYGLTVTLLRPHRRRRLRRVRRVHPAPPGLRAAGCARLRRPPPGTDEPYAVKEMFYTLQGEGAQRRAGRGVLPLRAAATCGAGASGTGRRPSAGSATPISSAPTVPVAGCSAARRAGRPRRRDAGDRRASSASWSAPAANRLLQLDAELVDALHGARLRGRHRDQRHGGPARRHRLDLREPQGGDRGGGDAGARSCKVVFPQDGLDPSQLRDAGLRSLPAVADGRTRRGLGHTPPPSPTASTIPRWRLSLQTHKILGIP